MASIISSLLFMSCSCATVCFITLLLFRKGFTSVEFIEILQSRFSDPRTKGFTNDGKFPSDQYRSVYSLSNAVDKCGTQEMLKRSLTVAVAVCALARETTMFGKKLNLDDTLLVNPDVIFIGELILKHLHIIGSNAHSVGV